MGRLEKQVLTPGFLGWWGLFGLCAAAAMNSALASSPLNQTRAVHAAAVHRDSRPLLDLRPSLSTITAVQQTPVQKTSPAFPSSLHHPSLQAHEQIDLPVMGAGDSQPRTPSRMEEFARRVHREGLPVARLWENKSALLSLGLNKKGKPGLWIVQKTR